MYLVIYIIDFHTMINEIISSYYTNESHIIYHIIWIQILYSNFRSTFIKKELPNKDGDKRNYILNYLK